tara:strand:+ start:1261 stop:1497 length:237 start_codon:yes stop_codon:yes gene_type:complete
MEAFTKDKLSRQMSEIASLTEQVDRYRSLAIDLEQQLQEAHDNHLDFVTELQEQVRTLTSQLEDLNMDMARNDLDKLL